MVISMAIERARKLFDEVVVAVTHNDEETTSFSHLKDRLDFCVKQRVRSTTCGSLSSTDYSSSSPEKKKLEQSSAVCARSPF